MCQRGCWLENGVIRLLPGQGWWGQTVWTCGLCGLWANGHLPFISTLYTSGPMHMVLYLPGATGTGLPSHHAKMAHQVRCSNEYTMDLAGHWAIPQWLMHCLPVLSGVWMDTSTKKDATAKPQPTFTHPPPPWQAGRVTWRRAGRGEIRRANVRDFC